MKRPEQSVGCYQKFLVSAGNVSDNNTNLSTKNLKNGGWRAKTRTGGFSVDPISSWIGISTGKSDEIAQFSFQTDLFNQEPFFGCRSVQAHEQQFTPMRKNEKICEVLVALRDLKSSQFHTKENSMSLDIASVDNAYFVLNLWPNDIQEPIIDIDEEGYVCLYIFDNDEFLCAGIEFFSKEHMATYAILHSDREDAECGFLDTQSEIIKFFKQYKKHWPEKFIERLNG